MAYRHERGDASTHLEHAKHLAIELVRRLGSGSEQVALVSAAEPASAVIGAATYDLTAAAIALQGIPQTARSTDLAGALEKAHSVEETTLQRTEQLNEAIEASESR